MVGCGRIGRLIVDELPGRVRLLNESLVSPPLALHRTQLQHVVLRYTSKLRIGMMQLCADG